MTTPLLIGSHVSMSGQKMLVGAAEEAISYSATTMMVFTGAPQNTRRKPIAELRIPEGQALMTANGIAKLVVHAPYILNLGNTIKPEKLPFAIEFMQEEVRRADALGAYAISFHPGAHVGAGADVAITQIAHALDEIISRDQKATIALETMAGKGTEVGRTFEELARIIDRTQQNDHLSVTFDTCHTSDAGYDIKNDFDGVLNQFDHIIGLERLSVIHLNDSKNPQGSHKDRHTNLGFGTIGFDALNQVAHHPQLTAVPKIMETPYLGVTPEAKGTIAPYAAEIAMVRAGRFDPDMIEQLRAQA
ncbi:deoxyribonuclease IV [Lapidilactobacillus achengensis]|uniref:Probable endonuclease 4 n=1 Tax=Lapidilactobacillus achengensis TaxID=2486000 RepID=A0ABW1UM71_9LACO|nr:deoxyribonuclease IV [Lapidilactobacillus achengensis]